MSTLTERILEVAVDDLLLDPADHEQETRQNTWTIGAYTSERAGAEASVAAALRGCAERIGRRFPGTAGIFYAWYDYQNGYLYVSVTTRDLDDLPFGSRVELVDVDVVTAAFCEMPGPGAWPGFTAVWARQL